MEFQHTKNAAYCCNGDLLRFYRDRHGLTQGELADAAGYSVRLIGKAEAGQPIRMATIEALAKVLSEASPRIGAVDLISDPLKLAENYILQQNLYRDDFVDQFEQLVSPNFSLTVHANDKASVLGAEYKGVDGLRDYHRKRCAIARQLPEKICLETRFCSLGNEVVAWCQPAAGEVDVGFRSTTKLRFSNGLLVEQEDRISFEYS